MNVTSAIAFGALFAITSQMIEASVAAASCSRSTLPGGAARFVISEGEVRDGLTGLIWQRCSVGLVWKSGAGCVGEKAGVSFARARAAVTEAGSPWRLPTAQELVGLLDRECGHPAVDTSVFPDVTSDLGEGAEEYWSSTPAGIRDMFATVEFFIGYSEIRSPGFERRARLVRTGPRASAPIK